ncbi:extracellular solute-binding protein [Cohnella sp. GCM10020058]|uniref:extracellular solute-binding protein n=1 Tax=Cohnella sp. GCM10020058 TaxID=3317330 RepID=UPI0036444605
MKTKQSRKTFRIRQEEMLSRLRQDILDGVRKPGEFLPSEKDLSDQFALSNKIVRDVLAELAAEGLIEKKPRIGSVVSLRSEPERIIVKLGHHGSTLQETELKALLAGFEALYPHIRVQDVTLPGHDPEVLQPYLSHGLIDVMTLNDAELRAFGETGVANGLLPLEGDPECHPFLTDAMTIGDALLARPFTFSPTILCYNREHFREREMWEPDSGWGWEELLDAADRLTLPQERAGFHFSATQRNRIAVFLLQSGAKAERDADGRLRMRGTRMLAGVRRYKEIVMDRMAPLMSERDAGFRVEELFAQGKLSMMLTTYYGLNALRQGGIAYDIAPLPRLADPVTLVIAIGLAVNRHSLRAAEARLLAEYLTGPAAQASIRRDTLSLPALRGGIDESVGGDGATRPSRFGMYREIIPSYRFGDALGLLEREWRWFLPEVMLYLSGLRTEEAFCERIEALAASS